MLGSQCLLWEEDCIGCYTCFIEFLVYSFMKFWLRMIQKITVFVAVTSQHLLTDRLSQFFHHFTVEHRHCFAFL